MTGRRVIPLRWPAVVAVSVVGLVGLVAFTWPFFVTGDFARDHGNDAPWLFAVLLGLLAVVCLAEVTAGRLDAKTIAVLGVAAAAGGGLRLLSAGTAGLEPMFFVVIVAGRVLGPGVGFVSGALAVTTGALLTGGVGPWLPFQMICAGGIGLGAGLLPVRAGGRAERWVLAAYALVTGLAFGLFMNLWFWPFLGTNAPSGMGFVPGAPLSENLAHYGLFYLATSLGWDLPRGVLNAVLVLLAGPALLRVFRRGARRAAFGVPVVFDAPGSDLSTPASLTPAEPRR
ncbi:ABC transporter permease [Terrabacter tumescens]|uniref:ABC transporter permease n=1 Tax=Terrabacter tumescens TaxID=60443 RepID=A0ABQ2HL45_9MICO|nr:ECF transporter S component [Terrabacter tumescens]GGM82759.1 ABC transporter permease [Terrabacter tumescens]